MAEPLADGYGAMLASKKENKLYFLALNADMPSADTASNARRLLHYSSFLTDKSF